MTYKINPIKNIDYIINYYKILEIEEFAEIKAIKQNFKNLAKQYHPDKVDSLGQDILEMSKKKTELLNEAWSVLSKNKDDYDQLLSKFKKDNPNLISNDGTPIIDFYSESKNLDFILSEYESFSFQKDQEEKSSKLIGYNETIFNIIEKSYQEKPNDESLKEAYLQQLSIKKAKIDMEEMFSWQELGVLNSKDVNIQNVNEYVNKIKDKIEKVKSEYKTMTKYRLLPGSQPLLLGTSKISIENESNKLLPEIIKRIDERIENKSDKLLKIAKEKQIFLEKMLKARTFKKVSESNSHPLTVILYDKENKVITTFIFEETTGVSINSNYDKKELSLINLSDFNHLYLLKYNTELELTLQVIEFISDIVNNNSSD